MASNAWKKAVWPGMGPSADASPSSKGMNTEVQTFGETSMMERHQHQAEPVAAKVIKTD